jgi:hypothetical protein
VVMPTLGDYNSSTYPIVELNIKLPPWQALTLGA